MPREKARLRSDIALALKKAFPLGVVGPDPWYGEASYLDAIYPKLWRKLSRLKGGRIAYDNELKEEVWTKDDDDSFEELPPDEDFTPSYRMIFLECAGSDMRFPVETEGLDEDDSFECQLDEESGGERILKGTEIVGCSVGISLIAPFAVVEYGSMQKFEDGSQSPPQLFPSIFSEEDGKPCEYEEYLKEVLNEKARNRLQSFRLRIMDIVESMGIRVLSRPELDQQVPFLRFDEEVLQHNEKRVTVRTALFFEML